MSLLTWLVLGLISGFIASKIVDGSGSGLLMNLVLGVVGAFVGGGLLRSLGEAGVTGLNFWSFFVAISGAVLVLVAYHAISGSRPGVMRRRT